jgi:hypothetical protein
MSNLIFLCARELIQEIDIFRCQCKPELRHSAQHLIDQIRFSKISLAAVETTLAHLEDKNIQDQEENQECNEN